MKKLIGLAMTLILAGGFVSSASAQEWPQKPIRIIVSFGPGGGADIIGRILADSMQAQLGKPVVVENKPGAGGIIASRTSPVPAASSAMKRSRMPILMATRWAS
jgi:tripartite-type tricarboxylate transporter receptor subunit TctC